MLDIIDLMNENFKPTFQLLDEDKYGLSFINDPEDHTFSTTADTKQLRFLQENLQRINKNITRILEC